MWAMPFMRYWFAPISPAAARRLTEEEETVYRHGRNAKPKTVPKSATVAEYAHATALEALFGWLYLKQRYDRINELFGRIAETF